MNIKSCVINAFLAIGHADIKLHEKGLVLLQGENRDDSSQDSNGAGKSTLPDALSWCFYGATARGESGDDVVNRSIKKGTSVSVRIEDDGKHWKITRHRKHKVNKNRLIVEYLPDPSILKWEDKTLGTDKLTQELVNKIVGCSKEVFCSAIYAGQENLVDLPSMTDKALKVIVEEAAGIDRLQMGHKIASARALEAKKAHDRALSAVERTESGLTLLSTNLEEAKRLSAEWSVERDKRMTSHVTDKGKLEAELDSLEEADTTAAVVEIDAKIAKVDAVIENAGKKASQCAVLESKLESTTATARREKGNYKLLMEDVAKAEKQLEAVVDSENPSCDECGQEIKDEDSKKAHIKTHKARLVSAQEKANNKKTEVEGIVKEALSIKSELSVEKSKLVDVSKFKDAHKKLTERKSELTTSSTKSAVLKEKIKEKQALYVAARDEKDPHKAMIEKLGKQQEGLESEKEIGEATVKDTEYQMLVKEGAAKVFSPSGVRAHLLDQVTPYLNDRTSHYLSILSDGNITATWTTLAPDSKGELKEKFSIAVESVTGGGSFRSLSGGEKRKVRLSTYLALQDLVSSRASKPINLLIADEIDQAVDKSGLERLMSVLTEKAKERGTAIVISHTDLKSWISNSVTIVKEDGRSRIEGSALS